ncbi:MAG: RNA polymerase factor sigma-54 [Betaproteobacteria bacterium RIFCSPLOWO2_02_FULL_67_26]|nr:MAG: RNA polymerase factor sigma-54 [Betaproteobacteria bacterium RIFCSPLOWO2_02_FULL_67_26]
MKHSLQLRLSQHLTLTPQLQQSIRLLQLSTLELNQELERILQENPLLERDEGIREQPVAAAEPVAHGADAAPAPESPAPDAAPADADGADIGAADDGPSTAYRDENEDGEYQQIAEDAPTLRVHLIAQLSLTNLSERDRRLVTLLIDSLDDDGYLTQSLDELVAILPPELGVELDELQIALKHLQNLEPAGVGARNLGECLALQLAVIPKATPHLAEALDTVKNHLETLAARDFARLRKLLHCEDAALRAVQKLITGLNPKPGRSFSTEETRYVVPDVIVKKVKGVWVAALNPDAMPRLRINRMYAEILQRNRNAGSQQLSSQLQEAKWLIKNVQQRFETILRVSQAIVDRQRHFFEHGEVAMRPLVLREIAEALDLHESTVSRVTTQKFMHTPRGIFELKYFFGSHVTTEAGGAASSTAIRALIKQLVSAENARKPLSDGQISEILSQQGIMVARRTVAKYRESMQILPVSMRKSL